LTATWTLTLYVVEIVEVDERRNKAACGVDNPCMLSFQRLDVYQRAIEWLSIVTEFVEEVPRGHSERVDQRVRSAESVVRNIAEAAGRWSPADTAKHYKMARGEAMECVASLDILKIRRLLDAARYARAIELLERIVAMLTKLCE
jgi:four helix bundle protein